MRIETTDGGYILENENGDTITLSRSDFLALAQNTHQLHLLELARSTGNPGYVPVSTRSAKDVQVRLDSHQSLLVIQFLLEGGMAEAFTLSPDLVEKLTSNLLTKLERLKSKPASPVRQ